MTINNLHAVGTQYQTLRIELMRVFEGEEPLPYYDGSRPRRHATIGIGFNLDVPRVRYSVYQAMQIPPILWAQLDIAIANPTYAQLPTQAQRDQALRNALNQILGAGQQFSMTQPQIATESRRTLESNKSRTILGWLQEPTKCSRYFRPSTRGSMATVCDEHCAPA